MATRVGLTVLLLLVATVAWGQGPRVYGSPSGFGNVVFPGMGTPPPVGSITSVGHAGRLGATVGGYYPPGVGSHGGSPGHGRGGRTMVVPYGVPIYYGGYGFGYGGYGYEQPPAPTTTVVQSPPVVINQYYSPEVVRPVMREYTDLPEAARAAPEERERVTQMPPPARPPAPAAPRAQPAEDKPTITLLAFTDSSIVAVLGYWIEGESLQYITSSYAKKSAPLKSLDRDLSLQLNRERNVEFALR
jgi:hypothetical protein